MAKKVHRPLEGMTWPQLCEIRNIAMGYELSGGRAFKGLWHRRVPVLHFNGRRVQLTDEGKRVWAAMQRWRPDLFTESN